jgi:hypothetical protein
MSRAWWGAIGRRRRAWAVVLLGSLVVFASTFAILGSGWIHSELPWGPPALALDAAGHPHVAWGTSELLYGTFDGSRWSSQAVDSGIYPESISLALDSVGHVHIAYSGRNLSGGQTTSDRNVKYATNSGGSWTVSFLAPHAGVPSIAIDSMGRVHLAFVMPPPQVPYQRASWYQVRSGEAWSPAAPLPSDGSELGRIVLDRQDHAYVPFHDVVPAYATNRDGTWTATRLSGELEAQSMPSLVVGIDGALHMTYTAWDPSEQSRVLRYATNVSGSWTFSTLDRLDNVNTDLAAIAMGPSGRPQIMYNDFRAGPEFSSPSLKQAVQMGDAWSISLVSANAYLQNPSAFAVGPGDRAHVIYSQDARFLGRPTGESLIVYATKGLDSFILVTFLMEQTLILALEGVVVALAVWKTFFGKRKRSFIQTPARMERL